jgi:hypothetical protein
MVTHRILAGASAGLVLIAGLVVLRAQEPRRAPIRPEIADESQSPVSDPSCTFFGPDRDKFVSRGNAGAQAHLTVTTASQLPMAEEVMAAAAAAGVGTGAAAAIMATAPGGSRTDTQDHPSSNTIDKYIFPALSAAGVTPAPPTTDFEFVRRVYLDLTGHIPTLSAVISFVTDTTPNKRAALVDSLIGSPEWLDKWTMWFGDLYQNNSQNTQVRRYIQGVMAFNDYVRTSLTNNKPYDQMAREIISSEGTNSYTQGEVNYLVGGVVTGGPVQDIFDQQAANTATTFLGLSNLNCLLCHDGRGHLDSINLWGYYTTRKQAWGMASFMSHTYTVATAPAGGANLMYWALMDNTRYTKDYALNTTTGNRPCRPAPPTPGGTCTPSTTLVPPTYILTGANPNSGENYRAALARMITSDFQFARATVNYVWEYFFTVGIVSPSNQFDPMRLDPNNPPSGCPPASPCTLQPSNAALLNALAQDFIASGYDLRALMKEIVNSNTYQLSSRYNGNWDSSTANLFGRKLVRRLWSEEVHDAILMSSGAALPVYGATQPWGPVSLAMKLPEPLNTPGGSVTTFLDAFLRGNRDDQSRRSDGSITQALSLMNDTFVMSKVNSTKTGILNLVLAMTDDHQLVNTLFLQVLSRFPTSTEMNTALANLKTNRTQETQNLLWSLYNKVDFVFNY